MLANQLETQCKEAILFYAPEFRQLNAALDGEYRGYINVVRTLLRDHYAKLVAENVVEWYVPQEITDTLTAMNPW